MSSAADAERVKALLRELKRQPFDFQAELAVRCSEAVAEKTQLLVAAPTGTGKTLISHLTIALLSDRHPDRYPRVLVICPSRALLVQQIADAGWLRRKRIAPLHIVTPDLPVSVARMVFSSYGVILTTPITLARRLQMLGGPSLLQEFDFAVFDEIDTYLTLDELEERRDMWPALEQCQAAGLPIIGFTGTNLSVAQEAAWTEHGFTKLEADVPDDWMPFTRTCFIAIEDEEVRSADAGIRDQLRAAYGALEREFGPVTWSQVKRLAEGHHPHALRVLELCYERLELFESLGSELGKLHEIQACVRIEAPTLVLSRFRHSARTLLLALRANGLPIAQADGGMSRETIERVTREFREAEPNHSRALIITRELGGRGLDFPNAGDMVMVSPRSNHQTVAQELARIRSRQQQVKKATILYYADTEEQAKARRLGEHLRRDRFRDRPLFDVIDLPTPSYSLEPFESMHLRHEESLDARLLSRLHA